MWINDWFRYVYSGDSKGGFCIWDLQTGQTVTHERNRHKEVEWHSGRYHSGMPRAANVRDVDWHPHYPLLATSG